MDAGRKLALRASGYRRVLALASALVLLAPGSPRSMSSEDLSDPEGCVACHRESYGKGLVEPYVHPPFLRQECDRCHGQHEVIRNGEPVTPGRTGAGGRVFRDPDFVAERTVLLEALEAGALYDIRMTFEDRAENRVTQTLTDVEVLAAASAAGGGRDRLPPRISGIRAGPVTSGPFLSTVITWETDEPATSTVQYGEGESLGDAVRKEDVWVRHHRVPVHGLRRGTEYRFRVLSRDVFGNASRSEVLRFRTNAPVPRSVAGPDDGGVPPARAGGLAVRKAEPFLAGSALAVYAETSRPASVRVTWKRKQPAPGTAGPDASRTGVEVRLDGLRRGRALTIDACNQSGCHPPSTLGISHPVGVALRDASTLPIPLPTLEGGVITCVSCHRPHGGKRKYFAQADFSRDICVACHTKF